VAPADRPSVSIVLPALNERGFIRDALDSLAAQDEEGIIEILVVDGGSTDGTREIVEAFGAPVLLLDNPRITAAAAMNIGIAAAHGDVVCRADAHTLYEPDYVRRCVDVLVRTGAANVGGRMRPVGTTSFGRAVAAATTSPFGVGPGRFHYFEGETDVDTVYLGTWWRRTLQDLGGYDEDTLQWAAEDQELNLRIRQAGGRIVLSPEIRSWYFPRETVRGLWRQYFNYGVCKASTLAKHHTLPSARPLAPAALLAASLAALLFGRGWTRASVPLLHLGVVAGIALRESDQPGVAPHRTVVAIETMHWSYGMGLWSGLFRILRGAGFESRPSAHR
jgi:glycosyltransferase involved in cell wall biosynthesis